MYKLHNPLLLFLLTTSSTAHAHGEDGIVWGLGFLIALIVVIIFSVIYLSSWKLKLIAILGSLPIPMLVGMVPSSLLPLIKDYSFSAGFWPTLISGVAVILILHYFVWLHNLKQRSINAPNEVPGIDNKKKVRTHTILFLVLILPYVIACIGLLTIFDSLRLAKQAHSSYEEIKMNTPESEIVSSVGRPDFESPCGYSTILAEKQCAREAHYVEYLANRGWAIKYSKENRVVSKYEYLPN